MDVHQGGHEHKQMTSSLCTLPVGFLHANRPRLPGNVTVAFTPAVFISPVFPLCFNFHVLLALLQSNLKTGLPNLWNVDIITYNKSGVLFGKV